MACIPCLKKEQPQHFYTDVFKDTRGTFYPLSLTEGEGVLNKKWIQSNISINPQKWTFRGLHYQNEPYQQSKYIQVVQGAIIDFMVNIKPESEEYGKVYYYAIEEGNAVYCPVGFAHGFITLDANTVIQYLVDNEYNKESEGGYFWSSIPSIYETIKMVDPRFRMEEVIMSEKDTQYPFFS
jgi:dTDP-4-dehydrorhamnose 3,5-epimerase